MSDEPLLFKAHCTPPNSDPPRTLHRGDMVISIRKLNATGDNVRAGSIGVVFEEEDYHEKGTGPMVRWINGWSCNVYPGDVEFLDVCYLTKA